SRMLPLADEVVEMMPILKAVDREPEQLELQPGQVLFRQGDRGDLIYIIESGNVEIVREHADGGEELRTVLGPGDYFGEIGPFFGLPRSATARARGATTLTGYTTRVFRQKIGAERLSDYLGSASEDHAS